MKVLKVVPENGHVSCIIWWVLAGKGESVASTSHSLWEVVCKLLCNPIYKPWIPIKLFSDKNKIISHGHKIITGHNGCPISPESIEISVGKPFFKITFLSAVTTVSCFTIDNRDQIQELIQCTSFFIQVFERKRQVFSIRSSLTEPRFYGILTSNKKFPGHRPICAVTDFQASCLWWFDLDENRLLDDFC